MTSRTADGKDIRNAPAWADIVGDILGLVPAELREEVLAAVVAKRESELLAIREGKLIEFTGEMTVNPNWNAILRLKGLLVQVLARDVTCDSSAEDAAAILFGHQRYGNGSGFLLEYIGDLPPIPTENREK